MENFQNLLIMKLFAKFEVKLSDKATPIYIKKFERLIGNENNIYNLLEFSQRLNDTPL